MSSGVEQSSQAPEKPATFTLPPHGGDSTLAVCFGAFWHVTSRSGMTWASKVGLLSRLELLLLVYFAVGLQCSGCPGLQPEYHLISSAIPLALDSLQRQTKARRFAQGDPE